ncbi:hypothetical protein [Flavobacterium haoranii]|uniref:Uncharacterized protein n=1 Tax=Flavobacterium haoranii TaxID=683124 RepID=A0A1M6D2U2_9FLAO|nr:hypothetical protein [Flavobacterium haoranii]SHI67550.1 hypothetical protein SAMN05444337_0531 [Flavobacterium haoranii]
METLLKQLENELKTLKKERKEMRRISTNKGFYKEYFLLLPHHETQEETFNHVNNKYFQYFGELKYKDFQSFKTSNNC